MQEYNLERFVSEQSKMFAQVISELRRGEKLTHWMWFIFPQVAGLGKSVTADFFAIQSLDEAQAYLDHPLLGQRLKQCSELLLDIESGTISEAFGFPDDLKLKSSMTLFAYLAGSDSVFDKVLQHHFGSQYDVLTLDVISQWL